MLTLRDLSPIFFQFFVYHRNSSREAEIIYNNYHNLPVVLPGKMQDSRVVQQEVWENVEPCLKKRLIDILSF